MAQTFGDSKSPVSLDPFHLVTGVQWGGAAVIVEATMTGENDYSLQSVDPHSDFSVPSLGYEGVKDDAPEPAIETLLDGAYLKDYRIIMYASRNHVETKTIDEGGKISFRGEALWGDTCFYPGGIEAIEDGFTLFGAPRIRLVYGDPNSDAIYVGDYICGFIFNNDPGRNRNDGAPGGSSWDSHINSINKIAYYSEAGKRVRRGVILNDDYPGSEPPLNEDSYTDGGIKRRTNQWFGDIELKTGPTKVEIIKRIWLVSFYGDLKTIKLFENGRPRAPEFPFSYTNRVTLRAYSGGKFRQNPNGSVTNVDSNGVPTETPSWHAEREFDYLGSHNAQLLSFNEKGMVE